MSRRQPSQEGKRRFPDSSVAASVPGQDGLHLLRGRLLLVLLEQLVAAAHAPVVGLGQAGAVGPAGAGAQVLPVVTSSPGWEKKIPREIFPKVSEVGALSIK